MACGLKENIAKKRCVSYNFNCERYNCICYMNNKIDKKSGLTEQESSVAEKLVEAWNEFSKLEQTHPSDLEDFQRGIHQLQHILGMRTLRRLYPEYYKSYKKDNN